MTRRLNTVGGIRPRAVAFVLACCAFGILLGSVLFGCIEPTWTTHCASVCAKSGQRIQRSEVARGLCECEAKP